MNEPGNFSGNNFMPANGLTVVQNQVSCYLPMQGTGSLIFYFFPNDVRLSCSLLHTNTLSLLTCVCLPAYTDAYVYVHNAWYQWRMERVETQVLCKSSSWAIFSAPLCLWSDSGLHRVVAKVFLIWTIRCWIWSRLAQDLKDWTFRISGANSSICL